MLILITFSIGVVILLIPQIALLLVSKKFAQHWLDCLPLGIYSLLGRSVKRYRWHLLFRDIIIVHMFCLLILFFILLPIIFWFAWILVPTLWYYCMQPIMIFIIFFWNFWWSIFHLLFFKWALFALVHISPYLTNWCIIYQQDLLVWVIWLMSLFIFIILFLNIIIRYFVVGPMNCGMGDPQQWVLNL